MVSRRKLAQGQNPRRFENNCNCQTVLNPVNLKKGCEIDYRVRSPSGCSFIYRQCTSSNFDRMMNTYCQIWGKNKNLLRFVHQTREIKHHQTPMLVNMQEGDVVDVYDLIDTPQQEDMQKSDRSQPNHLSN